MTEEIESIINGTVDKIDRIKVPNGWLYRWVTQTSRSTHNMSAQFVPEDIIKVYVEREHSKEQDKSKKKLRGLW